MQSAIATKILHGQRELSERISLERQYDKGSPV